MMAWEKKEVYVVTISLKNIDEDGEELNWSDPFEEFFADTLGEAEQMRETFLAGEDECYGNLVENCYISDQKEEREFSK